MYGVGRHGSRYPTGSNLRKWDKLLSQLRSNHTPIDHAHSSLVTELLEWKNHYEPSRAGNLTTRGHWEQYCLAKRVQERWCRIKILIKIHSKKKQNFLVCLYNYTVCKIINNSILPRYPVLLSPPYSSSYYSFYSSASPRAAQSGQAFVRGWFEHTGPLEGYQARYSSW